MTRFTDIYIICLTPLVSIAILTLLSFPVFFALKTQYGLPAYPPPVKQRATIMTLYLTLTSDAGLRVVAVNSIYAVTADKELLLIK